MYNINYNYMAQFVLQNIFKLNVLHANTRTLHIWGNLSTITTCWCSG